MAKKSVQIKTDKKNANKGTARGREILERSLTELGAGRSILLDKDGNVIAGNKTFEAASKLGLEVKVVETKGDELIAVKRVDLDLEEDAGKARQLAYADNRTAELDLEWDHEQLMKDLEAGVDLEALGFNEEEISEIVASVDDDPADPDSNENDEYAPASIIQYNIVFDNAEQQDSFFDFLKHLRASYDGDTLGERLQKFIRTFLAHANSQEVS